MKAVAPPPDAPPPARSRPKGATRSPTSPTSRTASKADQSAARTSAPSSSTGKSPVLFECQALAPSPGQTFYHVTVERDQARVALRDWPRLRYSQAMAKQSVQPGQVVESFQEYLDGSIQDKIREVFGDGTAQTIRNIVQEQLKLAAATTNTATAPAPKPRSAAE
ncbi:hypothetical protein AMAG_18652 [Allomyces macrogynus ATCC 38327]|uniref:Uncharacterized protein n=1 Tax=Allomyces macrogynus (strain ATCC 38327) TaxID=578462 RepID=A0A0L0SGE0_ALLM3|nr:hypothetical protein AMAG_18652 [Allomyces macrogynus ATCC 38327]|eukprot:KNE61581.1 hypothetical protein AMAG_18652 [Allomyces macrogynus ATCC 38327]